MSEVQPNDFTQKALKIVAEKENFKNFEILYDQGSNLGDGYIGSILRATIKELNDGRELVLLAKVPPSDQSRRKQLNSMLLFQREVYVYNVVLPEFVKMQEEMKISESMGFYNFPKIYFAEYDKEQDDAVIVMEDLRDSGHKMWNKFEPINFEHASLLMKALGRFHALSFAMKVKKPQEFEKFKELNDMFTVLFNINNIENFLQDTFKDTIEPLNSEQKEKSLKLLEEIREIFFEIPKPDWAEPFSVVAHGDCWSNNFLFHYGDEESPDNIVLLDWQISRYCSPAIDILYFIFISTDENLRANHFDELLQVYHNSLEEMLKNFECHSEVEFPFSAFIKQLKRAGKYGVAIGGFVSSLVFVENSKLLEIILAAKKQNLPYNIERQFQLVRSASKAKTIEKMRKVIIDACNFGYL